MKTNSWPFAAGNVVLPSLFACLCLAYLDWGWSHDISDMQGDSSGYALAAQYFAPFRTTPPLIAEYVRGIEYPPLFPMLIGLFGGSLLAAHLVVVASLLAAIAALYLWLRRESLPREACAWAALVFGLAPGTYLQALNIWTENTYLLLSLLALWLVSRAESNKGNHRGSWWLAAAAVAAAPLVRVAGAPLLLAFVLRLAVMRPTRWLALAVAAGAPFAAWTAWGKLHDVGIVGYTAHWAAVYGNHGLETLAAQINREWFALLVAWVQLWLGETYSAPLLWIATAFGALCLAGWLWRLRKGQFDALYVLVYALLLLAWPHPEEARRYGYVLLPVLLGQGTLLLDALAGRRPGPSARLAVWGVLGVMTIALLPSLVITASRFLTSMPADMAMARRTEYWYLTQRDEAEFRSRAFAYVVNDLHKAAGLVPEGDCIFSIKPSIVMLYAGRTSLSPPPESTSDAEFRESMKRCRYALPIAYTSTTMRQPLYPLNRLSGKERVLLVAKNGDAAGAFVFAELIDLAPAAEPALAN